MKRLFKTVVVLFLLLQIEVIGYADGLPITSSFGWRNDPYTDKWAFHAGVDLGYEYGSQIPALFDGNVVSAGNNDDGYGNQVLLYHPQIDVYTRYAHCSVVYVVVGNTVSAGDVIALVGSTGKSTGPHLHLEYIIDTSNGYQYENPLVLWQ